MGPVRNPARGAVCRENERQQIVDEQVETQDDPGWNLNRVHEEGEQEHEQPHRVAGKPEEVEPQHPGNGAGRADQRELRSGGKQGVKERGGHAGQQVPERVAHRPEAMLDIVAVNPEEQHIPKQVHEAAMQEHRRQQIEQLRRRGAEAVSEDNQIVRGHAAHRDFEGHAGRQTLADGHHVSPQIRIAPIHCLAAHGPRDEKVDRDIDRDQRVIDNRHATRIRCVTQRQDHGQD